MCKKFSPFLDLWITIQYFWFKISLIVPRILRCTSLDIYHKKSLIIILANRHRGSFKARVAPFSLYEPALLNSHQANMRALKSPVGRNPRQYLSHQNSYIIASHVWLKWWVRQMDSRVGRAAWPAAVPHRTNRVGLSRSPHQITSRTLWWSHCNAQLSGAVSCANWNQDAITWLSRVKSEEADFSRRGALMLRRCGSLDHVCSDTLLCWSRFYDK